jgi:hypothetical protein
MSIQTLKTGKKESGRSCFSLLLIISRNKGDSKKNKRFIQGNRIPGEVFLGHLRDTLWILLHFTTLTSSNG